MELIIATQQGVIIATQQNNEWQVSRRSLSEQHVTSVIAREGVILAGTTDGIFCSEDIGKSWYELSNGLSERHVRWMAFHPDISDFEFAGTEPAGLFVSRDGGANWVECIEISALRAQFGWWLPYSSGAGCVRDLTYAGDRVYAAVEVGGVLRSDDGGETWAMAVGSSGQPKFVQPGHNQVHADVHSVVVHPSSADLVFACTGGGFYRSQDGGVNWQRSYPDCYVRAVWIDPLDPKRIVLGPSASSSGRNGRIEVTTNGGESWQETAVQWSNNMVERFKHLGNHLFAVLANGELLQTHLPTKTTDLSSLKMNHILPNIKRVNDVTTMFT